MEVITSKPYSALLIISHCALCRKYILCTLVCGFCVSRKGGTGKGGWGHPQGDMHMVAARLGCEGPWLGLGGPPPTLTVWVGLENTTFTL